MKRNVLVFSGGSYPGVEIYFCLKDNLLFNPIAGSSYEDHSQFLFRESYCDLPYIQDEDFIYKLNELIGKANIDFIIPTHDTIAMYLMEHELLINAIIVCSPYETTVLCRHKLLTYQYFKDTNFIPKIYDINDKDILFPVFCKKDIGEGSRDTHLINNYDNLSDLMNKGEYIICENLPGEEITVDCFTNRNGKLMFINPRNRQRIMNGISARTSNIDITDEILHIIESINKGVRFRGYWFAQLKKDINDKYKLLEICTRFAGSFNLSKNLDVNLPLLALCDRLDMDIEITPNNYKIIGDKTYIDRYKIDIEYERVYIDFDDTLVFNRTEYNTLAMMFLYQCFNKNKKIVLITKHQYNIIETFNKIHFNEKLFSEIIQVPINSPKYLYIKNDIKSIFIDNSYAERKNVKKHLNIYTFDVSNIEALIDWS